MGIFIEEKYMGSINLLLDLLSIPSVNGKDDESIIAGFICRYLRECGINAWIQEIDKTHANVIAWIEGISKDTMIWNGHMDTVPYGELSKWETDPSRPERIDEYIYARGASDMKSGLAAMIYVLGKMYKDGKRPNKSILFLGTCDEEKGGIGAKAAVNENFLNNASFILIGEPTGCALGMAQKGCIWVKLNTKGITSHGAYPWEGINAIEYSMGVLKKLKERMARYKHPLLGEPTAQVTMLHGGLVANMTPDNAEMIMDIRTIPGMTEYMIKEWMDEIFLQYEKITNGKISFTKEILNSRIPIETPKDHNLVEILQREIKKQGMEAKYVGINYFTDASIFVQKESIPVLLFGPGEPDNAHKPNEKVSVDKYLKYIKVLENIYVNY